MKQMISLMAVLLMAGCAPAPTTVRPEPPVLASPIHLQSVRLTDDATGWAEADEGVFRTHDGGTTWTNVTPAGISQGAESHVFFLDAQTAWLLTPASNQADDPGSLYRTADGGGHWSRAEVPFRAGELFFVRTDGQLKGWAAQAPAGDLLHGQAQIYGTADAGDSWHLMATGQAAGEPSPSPGQLPYDGGELQIAFRPDGQVGWVVKGDQLFRSEDGGKTWTAQELPAASGLRAPNRFVAPSFFGVQDGVLLTELQKKGPIPVIPYMTHDGGRTWQPTAALLDADPHQISFSDGTHGWANQLWTGSEDALGATADGGKTWTSIPTNTDLAHVYLLQFVSERQGWGLAWEGSDTVLLRTTDGGRTWVQAYPGR